MLETRKTTTITGRSIIDNVEACGFQATIDSENPGNMTFSSWQSNRELYKANRTVCRADEAEFEDYCYELQDELLAAVAETETTEA